MLCLFAGLRSDYQEFVSIWVGDCTVIENRVSSPSYSPFYDHTFPNFDSIHSPNSSGFWKICSICSEASFDSLTTRRHPGSIYCGVSTEKFGGLHPIKSMNFEIWGYPVSCPDSLLAPFRVYISLLVRSILFQQRPKPLDLLFYS